MSGSAMSMVPHCIRARLSQSGFWKDRSGVAAIEFAMIVPIMLVALFATIEFSSAVAIDRKISLVARALVNLTSQGAQATAADLAIYNAAANKIMLPYVQPIYPTPNMTITELYIDPSSGNARVQWSQGSAPRSIGSIVAIPVSLIARNPNTNAILPSQYLIFSEVNVLYTPLQIGWGTGLMSGAGVPLSDVAYTRPRQSVCVFYPSTPSPATCPTS
jgi:Flp pilus assembly protein TadG